MATDSPGWQFDKFEDGSLSKYHCSGYGNRVILFLVRVFLTNSHCNKDMQGMSFCISLKTPFYQNRRTSDDSIFRTF